MRRAIRFAIPAAAIAGAIVGIALPVPHHLPSLALGSRELLWLERTLVLFYGFLLLFVPVLKALEGELPIELSTRGARYAELSDMALEELDRRLTNTESLLDDTIDYMNELAGELEADESADNAHG